MTETLRTSGRTIFLERQRIMFRNFAGEKKQYNDAGKRNFAIFLDEETAAGMKADGINVKRLNPREDNPEDGEGQPWVPVKVSYDGRPPKIYLVSDHGRKKTQLDEESAEMVDVVDIDYCDISVNKSNWEMRGEKGVSLYLNSIYVVIREDELDDKWRDAELEMNRTPSGREIPERFHDEEDWRS